MQEFKAYVDPTTICPSDWELRFTPSAPKNRMKQKNKKDEMGLLRWDNYTEVIEHKTCRRMRLHRRKEEGGTPENIQI